MQFHEYYLSGMVSKSCIKLIQLYFASEPRVEPITVGLGYFSFRYDEASIALKQIEVALFKLGFQIVKEEKTKEAETIKTAAIELIHFANNTSSLIRNSDYIADKVGMSYQRLSKVFSDQFNITLEKYIILLKIEKVKELLLNKNYSLSEISYMMGYSSVQYLSNQFKKITGFTVSEFKQKASREDLIPLDRLMNS